MVDLVGTLFSKTFFLILAGKIHHWLGLVPVLFYYSWISLEVQSSYNAHIHVSKKKKISGTKLQ